MAAAERTGFMLFLLLSTSVGDDTKESAVQCGVGQTVIQPCKHTIFNCSMVTWMFNSHSTQVIEVVSHGKVKGAQRSGKLTVGSDCCLLINNLNTEDTGQYTCRLYHNENKFTDISRVSLSVHKYVKTKSSSCVESRSTVSPTGNGGFPVVPVAVSCVTVCVGVFVTVFIILIYKRRPGPECESHSYYTTLGQENQERQEKVPDEFSVTYAVVILTNPTQKESNKNRVNIRTEYAAIRTTK